MLKLGPLTRRQGPRKLLTARGGVGAMTVAAISLFPACNLALNRCDGSDAATRCPPAADAAPRVSTPDTAPDQAAADVAPDGADARDGVSDGLGDGDVGPGDGG